MNKLALSKLSESHLLLRVTEGGTHKQNQHEKKWPTTMTAPNSFDDCLVGPHSPNDNASTLLLPQNLYSFCLLCPPPALCPAPLAPVLSFSRENGE